ncbi:DUF397 domain-containing protein [Streptosporangium roseum]|uniref:DUF397 domain-containing protein n=1 Tax=Streptosporangium roseum TaxID=2001 RepID=UPI0004CDD59B|nr:DUF397 domain-containing protein [Streptosporangium roseum]
MPTPDLSQVTWRKSSRSGNGQDCVEVGVWHKSSLSGGNGGSCVEVALADTSHLGTDPTPDTDRLFLVRDSKDPDGPVLTFSPAEWDAFLTTIKRGAL